MTHFEPALPHHSSPTLKHPVETMEGAIEKNDLMEVFYNKFIDRLIAPVGQESLLVEPPATNGGSSSAAAEGGATAAGGGVGGGVPATTLGLLVDLLCFCVQHHAFWAKYHVLR